jgi:hypothetical protein
VDKPGPKLESAKQRVVPLRQAQHCVSAEARALHQ